MVYTARNYSFAKSQNGDLLLVLMGTMSAYHHPRLIYDGGHHALLCKSPDELFVIPHIPHDISVDLAMADTVLVTETIHDETLSYSARCHFEQDVPALRSL